MLEFLEKLWNKLEIRVLVSTSLIIQILLLGLGGYRKHIISTRLAQTTGKTWKGPLAPMFHLLLWLAYLMADYVAIVALAYLRLSKINKATPQNKTPNLIMFWAPFFLLHLGGQDTITALSVEDNELWMRHLLTMISQVGLAIYNYISLNLEAGALTLPASLMLAVAIFKYVERIWCLQRASKSALQSSMTRESDPPGLDYAKQMQDYTTSIPAGLPARIDEMEMDDMHEDDLDTPILEMECQYSEVVCKAYEFFPTFKRQFLDLIMISKNWEDSRSYMERVDTCSAYKLIDIQLSWMYDILHTKDSVIYAFKHYGWVSRGITLIINAAVLLLFATSDHTEYGQFETTLTYVLLGVAAGLDIIALVSRLLSFWTYVAIKESGSCPKFSDFLFSILAILRPRIRSTWSGKMAQYSLITYSLEDKPCWWKSIMKFGGFKQTWDHYRYTTCVTVNKDLKHFVFQELKEKMRNIGDTASNMRFNDHRGQWALQRRGYYQEFVWSVEAEFDESILLWHIATDLLFNDPEKSNKLEKKCQRELSQHISNYMLFLLIQRPFMMPPGIGQIRYDHTSAEGTRFLQPKGDIKKGEAVRKILDMNTDVDPRDIIEDRNLSVFFTGCELAHQLEKEFTMENSEQDWDNMWRLISTVWVEMLCYAASKCSGQFHAKQLAKGGELLTVVWFLMAHLGLGEEYKFVKYLARAKSIINQ